MVVNAGVGDSDDVHAQNQATIEDIRRWKGACDTQRMRIHVLDFPALQRRDAGVGLARKLGLDEALVRLAGAGCDDGVLICLDADCVCDPNYLCEIERYFAQHDKSPGCSIYFEHPLTGELPAQVYRRITEYKLFLRYHRYGLQFAGFPYAFFTVGSCMAVRASAYIRQGGMNRRQAGEDFYFLNKIMQLGNFGELTTTRVVPAARVSTRTPFGTGRAQNRALGKDSGQFASYAPEVFRELEKLFSVVGDLYAQPATDPVPGVSSVMADYLTHISAPDRIAEIRRNTASPTAFRKRFFAWFNAFRVLKFIHYASDRCYSRVGVEAAVLRLLDWTGEWPGRTPGPPCAARLLAGFRQRDRDGRFP